MTDVGVVVPAYNEAGNLSLLIEELRDVADIVVVADNGSTDATAAEAAAAGAVVVHEPRRGYGFACRAGAAELRRLHARVVVFIDGDQSSRPAELPTLTAPVLAGDADLVLGSRTKGEIAAGAMPPHQRFGNALSSLMFRGLYRRDVSDLGPYRAIRADLLWHLSLEEMTFGWPTEMMVKTVRSGATMTEVPVSWDARGAGRSKVSGTVVGSIKAARHILGVTLRGRTAKMRVAEFERTW